MGRLVALVCNDPDRLACALAPVRDALQAGTPAASGVGSYQGGDVLLRRRPTTSGSHVDFFDVVHGLRTDTFIAHARTPTVGDNRNENTHPFRFRSWLFAHHGTLPGFGAAAGTVELDRPSAQQEALSEVLRAEIPDFLLRNLHGQTDSELLFHLFLTRLHESQHLDIPETRLVDAEAALHRTIRRLDDVLRERGLLTDAPSPFGAITLANGRFLLAAARGTSLQVRYTEGVRDCIVCREAGRSFTHEHLRAVLLVSDLPAGTPGFSTVRDGTVLAVARDLGITESLLR